jgi:hypothetical protein
MQGMRLNRNQQHDFLACQYAFGQFGIRMAGWVRWHSAVASSIRSSSMRQRRSIERCPLSNGGGLRV